jgi:hypothetical protein
VIVSLLTRATPREKLERFYALARTPVLPGEPQPEEPCMLPPGVTPAPRRLLISAAGLEIPVPSRTSVLGFAAGWVGVALLVVAFVWIVKAG